MTDLIEIIIGEAKCAAKRATTCAAKCAAKRAAKCAAKRTTKCAAKKFYALLTIIINQAIVGFHPNLSV